MIVKTISFNLNRTFSKNVLEAFASHSLSETNVSPVSYDTIDSHPLSLFVKGDYQKRDDLLSHPQVESFLFITKNHLTELFYPQLVKEFEPDGTCTIKLTGIIGQTLGNYSIISISASEAFSDVLTFWTKDNLHNFPCGKTIPAKKIRKTAEEENDNKPWVPSLHPVALFRTPICIPKLRGYTIDTGLVSKQNVRTSLQNYSRLAVDWFDVITSHHFTTKHAKHNMFDDKYLPNGTNKPMVLDSASLQPTFEMDRDSLVFQKQSNTINIVKTKCLSSIERDSVAPSKDLDQFRTPQRITFHTPKTPKQGYNDDMSISSEAVKEKAKHSVLFYRLFLSSKYTDPSTGQTEIILGNLSDTFLQAINAGRSEGTRIFNNTFTTYRKDRLDSDSYLDTAINFPHTNRTMISLLMIGDYRATPLDEDVEYLSQTVSALSFLPPPKKGEDSDYNMYVQKSKNTNMENAIEERAEKCSAYDKKLFTKGRQHTYQDAITTIANLVVFLEFIFDEAESSETPALITMLKGVAKILVTPAFRNYAEKNETKIPWLTHTLICQVQSILNRFVDLASNWTSQRLVENEGTLAPTFLDSAYRTYERISNNLDDTLNNSSNILFGVKPLSYNEKAPAKRRSTGSPSDGTGTKRQNNSGVVTKGWLVCTGGSFSFPENLSKQPCRNYVTDGLNCSFGRNCRYEHKSYPKGFRKMDQSIICDWIKKTNNVEFASFVAEADRNIKYSLFTPKAASTPSSTAPPKSSEGTTPTANPAGTTVPNGAAPPAAADAS